MQRLALSVQGANARVKRSLSLSLSRFNPLAATVTNAAATTNATTDDDADDNATTDDDADDRR